MSNYPNNLDDDATLPVVNDNLTEVGGEAINALRDAVMQIELTLGTNVNGTAPSLAARLGVFINPDGTPNSSVITSLGLVTLPVRNDQIAENAGIPESKLHLDYRTTDLFNYIRDLSLDVNTALGWISVQGIKLEPHLIGAIYRHVMSQIDVSEDTADFLYNNLRTLRDNTTSYSLVNDMNNELLAHQWADGSPFGVPHNITTNNGSTYTTDYAHIASGLFINTSRFNNIPQTLSNLQLFADFIDSASIFLLGTRIQNLYSAGISRVSQSSSLAKDGYGQFLVPPTPATAFLLNIGNASSPFDDINSGDDIVQFNPPTDIQDNNYFDSLFSLVKPGDIIRVYYGDGYNIEVAYVIKEKKYNATPGNKKYIIRIAGKNQAYSPNAIARIDKPLANNNKYGELSISPVNNQFSATPSLIINNPRGAQALGLGFDASQFDETHYLLYLAFYPTGFAADGYVFLPGIDVTGNQGTTPGQYTLESIVQATNNAFHAVGFNYRFTAFAKDGEFGICLADSYNNAGFSIVSAVVAPNGSLSAFETALNFPNNVISLIPTVGTVAPDPLGFGPTGSGVASPPFMTSYGSSAAAINATKLFIPLRRNNYYVNGSETERLAIEPSQALDGYGDGYWVATVQNVNVQVGRVETTYRIQLNLDTSGLKVGKTIVVQPLTGGNFVDSGRFTIKSVTFNCAPDVYTDIIVYDSVHAAGFSPTLTVQPYTQVKVYFSADSVSFNTESATDYTVVTPFKRHFEVYVDQYGQTFTHERGRFTTSGGNISVNGTTLYGYPSLNKMNIVGISPKLRGYQFGNVNKITLNVFNYSTSTGIIDGYLSSFDGTYHTHFGPRTQGKKGDVIRFYDETNVDYIDVIIETTDTLTSFSDQQLDFQLFPSLQLDTELMLLGTCQVDDINQIVSKIVDQRQFGNISEKDISDSFFDFLTGSDKVLHTNGIIRGFDIFNTYSGSEGILNLTGGVILVDGHLLDVNNDSVSIPLIQESYSSTQWPINWAVCIDGNGDYITIPLLDYDATLGTPNAPARIFTAFDPNSSQTYVLPSTTFVDLINKRTDITLLYIVSSVISGTGEATTTTLTTRDARKFIYKKDWGEVPTLVADANIGEFRNFESLASWFNFDSAYMNTVNMKGVFSTFPSSFTYNGRVKFVGDGNVVFNVTSAFSPTNIEFNNLTINATATTVFNTVTLNNTTYNGTSNCTFNSSTINNCTLVGNTGNSFALNNCTLNNCTINLSSSSLVATNTTLNNCTINCSTGSNIITITGSLAVLKNCSINFNSINNTLNATGILVDNIVTYNVVIGNTINLSSEIYVRGNKFTLSNVGAIAQILSIADGSYGVITGNYFFRSMNVFTSGYITAPVVLTGGVVSITDNYFDSSTIDGSDQNLVAHLPLTWVYKNNLRTPATVNARRLDGYGTYDVVVEDNVIAFQLTGPVTVNLPSIALSPPGRTITIKDANGTADEFALTLHPFSGDDAIENVYGDYVYNSPYGSITLVAIIDPNGGADGSGLTPKYMWCIV